MKKFSKRYFKWFLIFLPLYIGLILLLTIRLNYYIYVPGNLTDISDEIEFKDNNKKLNGSVSSVYIIEIERPSIFEYLVAKSVSFTEIYEMSDSEKEASDSSLDYAIGTYDSNKSVSNAYLAAYSLINSEDDFYKQVSYISSASKDIISNLKYTDIVGCVIKYIDGVDLIYPTSSEVIQYLNTIGNDEYAKLVIEDFNSNEFEFEIKRRDVGTFGLTLETNFKLMIESDIDNIEIFTQGPSGGAMNALYMYLMMSDEDLLNGRRIAGTGTISYGLDSNGNISSFTKVGSIGCVKEKLFAAYIDNAEVFYCPSGNFEDCMNAYNVYISKGYNIDKMRIVEISTLEDILDDLRGVSSNYE